MDKSYSVSEVADKLNISDKTLRRWEDAGRFRSSRTLGNQRRYSIEDIQILDAIKHGAIQGQADLLTTAQAANLCGVAEVTLERWVREGKIHPFITVGLTYYPRHQLLGKLAELKNSAPEPEITPPEEPRPIQPIQPIEPRVPRLTPIIPPPPSHSFDLRSSLFNILVTFVLLISYHLLFNSNAGKPLSPLGSVQGTATSADPSLTLLKTILGQDGALTTTTISARTGVNTPTLAFNPTSAPADPTPGTIYYDASGQTLKIWKGTAWADLASSQAVSLKEGTLITATAILPQGKNQVTVANASLAAGTPVTVTFTTDYAPAKKYWLEVNLGSFTLHTDFPVSSDAPFNYFILSSAPATPDPATSSASSLLTR